MRNPALTIAVLGMALAAGGCIMPFNGPEGVRKDLQSATGRDYDRTFALTVGRSGMALARWGLREAGEEEIPLDGIHKVEIGIYDARGGNGSPADSGLAARLWPGWIPLVEMYPEDGESILILSEPARDGSIRRLLFLVDDDDELVIVRMKGRLDHVIEEAMRYAFEEADRPELAEPSIEEYRKGHETPGDGEPARSDAR